MPDHTVSAHETHLEVADSAGFVARMRWEYRPRLAGATDTQRHDFRVSEVGVHWDVLDEHISFARIMAQFGRLK